MTDSEKMTYSEQVRRRDVARRVERQRVLAEKRELARDRDAADRAQKATDAVVSVFKNTSTFADFDALVDAAMAVDGLQDDPYYGDKQHGHDRLKRAIKNNPVTLAMLAEAGVVLNKSAAGIHVPDRDTMAANHAREERLLARRIDAENDLRERERIAFDVNFPKIEVRALTDGRTNGE